MRSIITPRHVSHALLLGLTLAVTACGGGDGGGGDDGSSSSPDSPKVLSFGANATSLTSASQQLVLTAVLTDPDGVDDIVGGDVTDDTGATLGAFATSAQEGAYSITLAWSALLAHRPDVPGAANAPVTATLTGTFYDQAGHTVTRTLDVAFDCGGDAFTLEQVRAEGCQVAAGCQAGDHECSIQTPAGVAAITGDEACAVGVGTACASCQVNRDEVGCTALPHTLDLVYCACD